MSSSNRFTIGALFAIVAALAIQGQMNPKPQSHKNDSQPTTATPAAPVQQVDIPEPITNGCAKIYTSFEGIYAENNCAFPIRVAYCQTSARKGCEPNNFRYPDRTIFPGKTSKLHFKDAPGKIDLRMITCAAPRQPRWDGMGFACVK